MLVAQIKSELEAGRSKEKQDAVSNAYLDDTFTLVRGIKGARSGRDLHPVSFAMALTKKVGEPPRDEYDDYYCLRPFIDPESLAVNEDNEAV